METMPPNPAEEYIAALQQMHRGGDGEDWAERWRDWARGRYADWKVWYGVAGIPILGFAE